MSNILPSSQASDIISYVRSRCRLGTAPPNAVFLTTQMLVALNDINEWFVYWPLDNGQVAPWRHTLRHKLYSPADPTTLAAQVSAGANTLTLTDGSDFDSPSSDAAAAYIKHTDWIFQFFTYESRSSNALSGVSTIDILAASGLDVYKLYTLPTDFGRPRVLRVNGRPFKYIESELSAIPAFGTYFIRYMVSTSNYDNQYLVMPESVNSNVTMSMEYVKRPTKISSESSKVDAPDGNARWALIKRFESFCWFHQGETELARMCSDEADDLLKTFFTAQSSDDASPDQGPTFDLGDEC